MGAYRSRRPLVWQDEMAEVRNLFQKVAQVRDSGFTGFSRGKDEPTAETLSRNRLRRRRCQYALQLTHLNYGESPYEALNHLQNIRGMCTRIQRQDRCVERKKKDCDLDLQPALLRRPVTPSYCWSSAKEGSDKISLGSSRPGSAPVMAGTPLYYTPSKPTALYDATHRCPRNKEITRRSSKLNPSNTHNRTGRTALKAMANNYTWETTTVASTGYSPATPSSIASSANTNPKVAPNACLSCRLSVDSAPRVDESITRRKNSLEPAYAEVKTASDGENIAASASSSKVESAEASVFSSSRASAVNAVERPPSRMMSKRPSPDPTKPIFTEKRGGNVPQRKDVHAPPLESAGQELRGPTFASSTRQVIDVVTTQRSRPPSRETGEGGKLLEEQVCKSNRAGTAPLTGNSASSPSNGNAGLWALRQEQQRRPTSAGAMMPRTAAAAPSSCRSWTSPTRGGVQNLPKQERIGRFASSPSPNKITGKKEQVQVRPVQRAFDQELQTVVRSEYGSHATFETSTRSEQQELRRPPVSPALLCQQQQQQAGALGSGGYSSEEASIARARANEQPTTTASGSDESHVMIRHSTDPYTDFKHSMLRMIDEENLYDKQWELEELFQYYMDLNPAVHHEVLQIVISDIRNSIATYKARPCYADSP